MKQLKQAIKSKGNTLSYLVIASQLVALLALGDKVKPEAKHLLQSYKRELRQS